MSSLINQTRLTTACSRRAALRAELQAEYLHLQKVIEDFDGRALTIKAWSITFSLVALAGAFASHVTAVLLVSSISALLLVH